MRSVGIRELRSETSEILRRVREEGETIQVTHRGQPVALLVPVTPPEPVSDEENDPWTELERLAAEISAEWPEGVSAVGAVKDVRRDL